MELDGKENRHSKASRRADRLLLQQTLSETSIHVISKATLSKTWPQRCLWISLLICAACGFSSNLYFLTSRYHQEPVLTQINHESADFVWPHLTICNPLNPIAFWRRSHLRREWDDFMRKAESYTGLRYNPSKGKMVRDEMLGMSTINFKKYFDGTIRSIVQSLSLDFQDRGIATSSGDLDLFKGVRNFQEAFYTRLEAMRYPIPCYTLTPESFRAIAATEKIRRIRLFFFMDFASYNHFNSGFENRKLYFYIGYPNHTLHTSLLFQVYAGTNSHFEINLFSVKRLKNCTQEHFHVNLYDISMNATRTYQGDFEDCVFYVSQKTFVERCGCYNPYLPIMLIPNTTPRLCFNMTLFNASQVRRNVRCLNRVAREFKNAKNFEKRVAADCARHEKPLCYQTHYSSIRHSNTWTDDMNEERRSLLRKATNYLPNAPKNATEKFVNQNLVGITVYRKRGKTPHTFEEYEYPISQLLSDIGGIMGLWLGISVISIFELFVIGFSFVRYLC